MLLTCKSCIVKQCNNSKIKCSEFGFVDKALLTEQWVTDKTKIHITKQSCLGWKGPQKWPTSNLPHHRQYHLPVPTALWKLWGVQCFSKPKKFQPPTAWQNRSTVFIKNHQLILVCSLNFLVYFRPCVSAQPKEVGTFPAGHRDSAAGNSMVTHVPQCIAFIRGKQYIL